MKKIYLLLSLVSICFISAYAQVDRNLVVVEIGTETGCQYCPGAALGADDLVANGKRVAIIENHNADSYANVYSNARNSWYGITGYPTAFFDGGNKVSGGNHTQSMYLSYLPKYNSSIVKPSPVSITYTVVKTGQQFNFNFTIKKESELPSGQLVFHFTVTQSEIAQNWQGQTHLNYVNRLMIPSENGTNIDLSTVDSVNVNIVANINASWPMENIEFVAFVQNTSSKAVLNTYRPTYTDFSFPEFIWQNDSVSFVNMSLGRPTGFLWSFEGGSPASSSLENPKAVFNTPGNHEVVFRSIVGLYEAPLTKTIVVTAGPTVPTGQSIICNENNIPSLDYSIEAVTGVTEYEWQVIPSEAGQVESFNANSCKVKWNQGWVGNAQVKVRVILNGSASPWAELNVECLDCTSVGNNSNNQISIYPVPAKDNVNIKLIDITMVSRIEIINTMGKVVSNIEKPIVNNNLITVNTNKLSSGVYILKLYSNKGLQTSQIVINK